MSITDPALQTLPRDDLVVRGAFVPRAGHVFISCDYDQVEARLAAHFSADPGLIEAFRIADSPGGRDFFSTIATELFQEEVAKKDRRRQMVKNMTYARLFGAGLGQMARTAGVTEAQMLPVRDAFNARYPGLERMDSEIMGEAHSIGGIMTPLGRFLPVTKGREYPAVNYKIQGHAAEVLKRSMIDAESTGLGDWMVLPVHDELLFEVPQDQAEDACTAIRKVMENRTDYRVPLTCKPVIMRERWTGKE